MATISKECWQSIQELFDQALDLPENKRLEFVELSCTNRPEFKSALIELLEAEKKSSTFFECPVDELYSEVFANVNSQEFIEPFRSADFAGVTIGAFRLTQELGRGGMGTVFLAERTSKDFDQYVAIKILSNNSQDKYALERFKREQQLLASLDHPNIAKLYDGGVNDDNLAYLVMEYVDGERVDHYCQGKKLNLPSRLDLIRQIASAVGFAHKHLVIHRDLKPSNILVKPDGTVKLLDFGIAKPFDAPDDLELTEINRTPMTPGFAAPEQLKNLTVSVATDIYQLGLVTYYLLTGIPAHSDSDSSLASLVKQVCEELPTAPSRVFTKTSNRLVRQQDTSADDPPEEIKFVNKLKGDLDAIVLKMLQIQPEDRYQSVDAFLRDLDAYFNNKPVIAQRASWIYFSKRFLQRHWKAAVLSIVFMLTLVSYALTTTWHRNQIEYAFKKSREEQLKSEQVTNFLINVFKAADPNVSGFDSVTAEQLLEKGEQRIFDELQNLPRTRNHMLNIFAQIWQRQGDFLRAQTILDKARELPKSLNSEGLPEARKTRELAKTLSLTGTNHLLKGDNELALEYTQQGLDMFGALLSVGEATADDEYAYLLILHSQALDAYGRYEEAKPQVLKAIDILLKNFRSNYEYLSYAYSELALIQHMSGEFTLARKNMKKAADFQKSVTGENHTYYTTIITNLAILYQDAEEFDEAEKVAREAVQIYETIFGADHSLSLHAQRRLAVILHRKGDLSEAESLLNKIVEYEQDIDQYSSNEQVRSLLQFGSVLQDAKKYDEAEDMYFKAEQILSDNPNNNMLARTLTKLAAVKYQQNILPQALSLYDQALSLHERRGVLTSVPELGKALVLIESGMADHSLNIAKDALDLRRSVFTEEHSWVIEAEMIYALALKKSTTAQVKSTQENNADALLKKSLDKAERSPVFRFGDRLRLYNLVSDTLKYSSQ